MKKLIGLVSPSGGGKGTAANLLKDIIGPDRVAYLKTSDVLLDTMKIWRLEPSRANFQKLAETMNKTFGAGTLTRAIAARIEASEAEVVILDSIRWPSDLEFVRSLPGGLLLYVTASKQVRFERLRSRNEKAGESGLTWPNFLEEEAAVTERLIPELGRQADFTIKNEGTLEEFRAEMEVFCRDMVLGPGLRASA